MSKYSMRAGLLIGCSIFVSAPVFAQSANPSSLPGQPEAETETKEAIVVVGSRIEGSKIAETLPVSVLNEDRISATGSVSGDDLFRSIPQAGDVQFQEARTTGNLNDARGDNASINLRSVGTGNTLVLVNGRRMILTPGTQTENFVPVQTANTNSLPVGATRRVEVLRDGAAAVSMSSLTIDTKDCVLTCVTALQTERVKEPARSRLVSKPRPAGASHCSAASQSGRLYSQANVHLRQAKTICLSWSGHLGKLTPTSTAVPRHRLGGHLRLFRLQLFARERQH